MCQCANFGDINPGAMARGAAVSPRQIGAIGENRMRRHIFACSLVILVALSLPAHAQTNPDWDGTWNGSWGGSTAAKVIVAGGRVVEYDYRGDPQRVGETTLSGNTLSFGTPPNFVVTLTRTSPTTASAHYHGPAGEADAVLTKQ